METLYIVLLVFGAFIGGCVVSAFGTFAFIKNNPKYLTQSLAKDKADAEAELAKIENKIKVASTPVVTAAKAAQVAAQPVVAKVGKTADEVVADIKKIL